MAFEANPQMELSLELEAFFKNERIVEEVAEMSARTKADFSLYSTIAGGLIGLVFGLTLISLSIKRTRKEYEIDDAECIACGKCFKYCPQNMEGGVGSLLAKK
jgi:NAD-dependent dihydropyrimidine dehydrogenase PreA subunit